MTAARVLKWVILTFVGSFLVIGTLMYFNLGMNKEPKILGNTTASFHMIYKEHIGPYHEVSKAISEVEATARSLQIACRKTFGEYIDNPELVDPDRLRSHVGCLVEDPSILSTPFPEGVKVKSILNKKYFNMSFDGSPAIGPMKVYPIAKEHWSTGNSNNDSEDGVIEVYIVTDGGNAMITEYYFPLKD